jgi:hypothetical protein
MKQKNILPLASLLLCTSCIENNVEVIVTPGSSDGTNVSLFASTQNVIDNPLYESPLRSFLSQGEEMEWGLSLWLPNASDGGENTSIINSKYTSPALGYTTSSIQLSLATGATPIILPTAFTDFTLTAYFPYSENNVSEILSFGSYGDRKDYITARSSYDHANILDGIRYQTTLRFKHIAARLAIFIDTAQIQESIVPPANSFFEIPLADFSGSMDYDITRDSFLYARNNSLPAFNAALRLKQETRLTISGVSKASGFLYLSDYLAPVNLAGKVFSFQTRKTSGATTNFSFTFPENDPSTSDANFSLLKANTIRVYTITPISAGLDVTFLIEDNPTWANDWDLWTIETADGVFVTKN